MQWQVSFLDEILAKQVVELCIREAVKNHPKLEKSFVINHMKMIWFLSQSQDTWLMHGLTLQEGGAFNARPEQKC